MLNNSLKSIANFFYEAGMLARTPRAGFHFLGSGKQSVAEHLNRMSYIVYALGKMDGTVDVGKMLEMTMFHDFSEARISDLGYVHQKYVERNENKAIADMTQGLPFGIDIKDVLDEYEARNSRESILVKDADNIELLVRIKEEIDIGNLRAESWLAPTVSRLQTDIAKELATTILETESDSWWYGDKDDEWWISRNKT